MLVLTRRVGEVLVIGNDVRLTVKEIRGKQVRISIDAPRGVSIDRAERLVGCGNWKPKHGVGPYCANCGFHENEHIRREPEND